MQFGPGWEWLGRSWIVLAAGLGLFVAERCVNRIRVRPLASREGIRTLAVISVWVGVLVAILTIGLPRLMVLIHNYGADVSTPLAKLAYALGPGSAVGLLTGGLRGDRLHGRGRAEQRRGPR